MIEGEVLEYAFRITGIPMVASNVWLKPICFARIREIQHGFLGVAVISVAS